MIDSEVFFKDRKMQVEKNEEQENDVFLSADPNNNNRNDSQSKRSGEKYGLRPRTLIKRLQHDKTRHEIVKKPPRSKSRPAPLSKYRRKTANARERHRMKEINNAFESLRKALPDVVETTTPNNMTKITTLRLAVRYIEALSNVLEDGPESKYYFPIQTMQESSYKDQDNYHPIISGHDTFHHHHHLHHQLQLSTYLPQIQMSTCNNTNQLSYTCSTTSFRVSGSLGSTSDFEEILSDDSHLLDDSIDVFHDIPVLPESDPFELLLAPDKESLTVQTELNCYK